MRRGRRGCSVFCGVLLVCPPCSLVAAVAAGGRCSHVELWAQYSSSCQWAGLPASPEADGRKGVSCIVTTTGDAGVAAGLTSLSGLKIAVGSCHCCSFWADCVFTVSGRLTRTLAGWCARGSARCLALLVLCCWAGCCRLRLWALCGCGGVDQIWPSGIPARFSGHSSLPSQPAARQGWIQVCLKEAHTFTCKLA